ncbi:helix-turn-helix domain-containing protein [Parerythrobacter aurantius]|uniref:AraC family transcriptional regulator n=1 Tax=Parerythrobacter aurantius TaxID=3127706 RepID=UPI0032478AB1
MDPAFRFRFIAAPADLARYINTLYVFETDEARFDDILPAYSAQIMAFGQGEARMQFAPDKVERSSEAFVIAPMQEAAPFSMAGPVRCCGVSLTVFGWAALAGLPVDRHGHRKFEADALLGEAPAARIAQTGRALAEGTLDSEAACAQLADVVRGALKPIKPAHLRFIAATLDWLAADLSPAVPDLVKATGLSDRQVQRLTKRYFGKPPLGLIRRYRAIRAATLLSQMDLRAQFHDEVLEAFFDQAHMIREIRLFTGRTPKILEQSEASVAADTLAPEGYGVVDLFGALGEG